MPVRVERIPGMNGGRVLTLDGGGVVAAPAPKAAGVRTGVVIIGTEGTIRQVAGGMEGVDGVVIAGAVVVGVPSVECRVPSGESPVPVLGTVEDLPLLVGRFGLKMALVCLPASMGAERGRVERVLGVVGIPVRQVVALEDVIRGVEGEEGIEASGHQGIETGKGIEGGHKFTGAAPSIDLAALIGRQPYEMDRGAISAILRGKCVLITGAGGSIGSELAKVAAEFEPSMLVLMERSENALFEIDRQIGRHFPGVIRKPVLHDVVDAEATLRACEKLRPQVVFHAAAHKHVPLMEDHPAHAVTNNLFGTKSIADAAVAVGAERFVMISSDKAVNPTSVMGATKRLAEMYVRGLGERAQGTGHRAQGGTRLSMVRFGNVLGSAASVLTIWAQQIAEGGPLTITDPRMTRYFMTIPEAATLVVQSAALEAEGDGVGVYVLDMGEPVRIVELAERFVRAHGMAAKIVDARGFGVASTGSPQSRTSGGTIDLVFTGIRPGEKLHEELAYAAEQLRPTAHPGVRAWAGPGFGADVAERMREMVDEMNAARFSQDPARVVGAIRKHVPEMRTGVSSVLSSPEPAVVPHLG